MLTDFNMLQNKQPLVIDAVITWVDGADVQHAKKRQAYLNALHNKPSDESSASTRFYASGEINYCIRSLLYFAPWVRTIYIVTDGQAPLILAELEGTAYADRIKLVDHREIFKDFEMYLPTFNSLAIESMLWRIPRLSEHFIYFNDDCALLRPCDKSDFFRDGLPVVRGEWKRQHAYKYDRMLMQKLARMLPRIFSVKPIPEHRKFQENSAKLAGYTHKFLHLSHVPFPLLKQSFADIFEQHPERFFKNLTYRWRSSEQFWSISLVYHRGIKQQKFVLDDTLQSITVHAGHHSWPKMQAKLARARRTSNTAFVCMQSLDQGTPEVRRALLRWLDACIPEIKQL